MILLTLPLCGAIRPSLPLREVLSCEGWPVQCPHVIAPLICHVAFNGALCPGENCLIQFKGSEAGAEGVLWLLGGEVFFV